MRFGEIPVAEAVGAILAHSVGHAKGVFKKGRVIAAADIEILAASGIFKIFAARLSEDDVPEDAAAKALATKICGAHVITREPFTGRANLHADTQGIVLID